MTTNASDRTSSNHREISRLEERTIGSTIVVYHPNDHTYQVWYHYPSGFRVAFRDKPYSTVYVTDPEERLPANHSIELQERYYCMADRQLATVSFREIVTFWLAMHKEEPDRKKGIPPKGVLHIPFFVAEASVPTVMPKRDAVPQGWTIYTGLTPGAYPLSVPQNRN